MDSMNNMWRASATEAARNAGALGAVPRTWRLSWQSGPTSRQWGDDLVAVAADDGFEGARERRAQISVLGSFRLGRVRRAAGLPSGWQPDPWR